MLLYWFEECGLIAQSSLFICLYFIGLSIERPILDHHPKAHVHEIRRISWNLADFTMKSGRFHEIQWISWNHEIQQISPWNPVDFMKSMKSVKSSRFHHEIWQISWNPVDFMKSMKSSRFHHEIQWISWNPWNLWNPADFTMKSGRFHEIQWISGEIRCFRNQMQMFQQKLFWFYKVWVDFTWNLPDFMKSAGFHLKSARFHEIHRISYGFHKIWRISWNPADFRWNRKTFARNCNSMFSVNCSILSTFSQTFLFYKLVYLTLVIYIYAECSCRRAVSN